MSYRQIKPFPAALALWALALAGAADWLLPSVAAQELAAPEYKIKAAFLYNFAKLTEWPASTFPDAAAPITFGVLGKDPFGARLKDVAKGKTIAGRPITIVHFAQLNEVKDCQLLFIPASENNRLSAILTRLADRPILTVGDANGFAGSGGIIGLVRRDAEIRFEVNRHAAARAGLTLSSKLLRLAEIVPPAPEGKDK